MFRGSRQSRARGKGRRRGQGRDRERQLREEEEGEGTDLGSGADDLSGDFNEAPRSGSRQETSRGGQRGRQGRQLGGGGGVGSCKTTGYESRIRDDCKNEFETQCKVIQETKFRTEIDQQCRTKVALSFLLQRVKKQVSNIDEYDHTTNPQLDQKCKKVTSEVPEQKCKSRYEER